MMDDKQFNAEFPPNSPAWFSDDPEGCALCQVIGRAHAIPGKGGYWVRVQWHWSGGAQEEVLTDCLSKAEERHYQR